MYGSLSYYAWPFSSSDAAFRRDRCMNKHSSQAAGRKKITANGRTSEFLLKQMGFSKSIGQGVTDNASNFPTTK